MRLFLNICSCICYILSFYFVFFFESTDSTGFLKKIEPNATAIVLALWGIGFILQALSFPSKTLNPEKWFEKNSKD
ncbi:MAG: hypothetical protein HN443_08750 [Flavobacteriaceae bacterium]|jgi:hypothetical protein|nr:hypothetical protein [Flavobacteriaceae bacterium]